jgi:hypothetical protein
MARYGNVPVPPRGKRPQGSWAESKRKTRPIPAIGKIFCDCETDRRHPGYFRRPARARLRERSPIPTAVSPKPANGVIPPRLDWVPFHADLFAAMILGPTRS